MSCFPVADFTLPGIKEDNLLSVIEEDIATSSEQQQPSIEQNELEDASSTIQELPVVLEVDEGKAVLDVQESTSSDASVKDINVSGTIEKPIEAVTHESAMDPTVSLFSLCPLHELKLVST